VHPFDTRGVLCDHTYNVVEYLSMKYTNDVRGSLDRRTYVWFECEIETCTLE